MFPQEFLERLRVQLGDAEYRAFLSASERPRWAGLRLNSLKTAAPPDLSRFCLEPVPWAPNGFYCDPSQRPGLSPYHDAGLYYLQEPSAMAPATLLDVRPGLTGLDLCAAPGGKSTQIASYLCGEGLLISNEIHPKRALALSSNLERLGVSNALILNEHPQRLAERFPEAFDRVLVDAPCSGEGMFRKEEAASADWSRELVSMCARRQLEILESASRMLRSGGRLVYSTCTFSAEENEGVISAFLKTHPDFHVAAADGHWFSPGRPDWVDAPAPGLDRTFRLWPHHLAGEGHFAAVLERDGDGPAMPMAPPAAAQMPQELRAFCDAAGTPLPAGRLLSFGGRLWMAPPALPDVSGLKVLRAGLELGEVRKGRFIPAHAWAMWLHDAGSTADYPADSAEIASYLAGEAIPGSQTGWTLLKVDGLSLGWVKGSGGILKNHRPKGLRRMVKRENL